MLRAEEDPAVEAWCAAVQAKREREKADRMVHNHGPTEGRGLDCPERVVDGRLRGACMGNDELNGLPPKEDDPFESALADILFELNNLMLKKHQDYGPLNIALAPGGALNGLRVRMHDKLARINNLHESGAEPNNESLEDSFKDIANYGIIGMMVLRGHWPGT